MPTSVKVRKWGNGLGLRLPRRFASEHGIVDGSTVLIDQLRVIDTPCRRRGRYKLKDLLKGYAKPPKNLHFSAAGREIA